MVSFFVCGRFIITDSISLIQTYLGDIESSVLDNYNEANIAIDQVTSILGFPNAYKSYVYTILYSIKCAIEFCLNENFHTLIENTLLLIIANHHLSFQ